MGNVTAIRSQAVGEFLSPAQVCEMLPGLTEEILLSRRKQKIDPPYHKPTGERGSVVLYAKTDIIAWVAESRVQTRRGVA